jgi:hypothetical protein
MLKDNGRLFTGSVEECVLRIGLLVYVAALLAANVLMRLAPGPASDVVVALLYHLAGSRIAGIAAAVNIGAPWWQIALQHGLADIAPMLVFHPIIVYVYERRLHSRFTGGTIARASLPRGGLLSRLGPFGLALFVWFPSVATGPAVASTIGYLLGLGTLRNLGAVSLGLFFSSACWAFIFRYVRTMAEGLAEGAASYIPLALVALSIVLSVVMRLRRPRGRHESGRTEPPGEPVGPSGEVCNAAERG